MDGAGTRGGRGHDRGAEDAAEPEESEDSGASRERDVAHAEGGRTKGETAVDDALGMGDR